MKKLMLFGSFFLISFFTGLAGDKSNVQADGYSAGACYSRTDCKEGFVSGTTQDGTTRCCYIKHPDDTGHQKTN